MLISPTSWIGRGIDFKRRKSLVPQSLGPQGQELRSTDQECTFSSGRMDTTTREFASVLRALRISCGRAARALDVSL